jgi:hypothetical protein
VTNTGAVFQRPLPVTFAGLVLLVLAVLQGAVASLFLANQPDIATFVSASYPFATPEEQESRIFAATVEGIVVHAMLVAVYVASAWTLRIRAPAVRIYVTALALVATLTDALILGQLPALLPNVATLAYGELVVSTALRALLIGLLWLPRSARAWYAREATAR